MENEANINNLTANETQDILSNGSLTLFFGFIRRFFILILIFTLLGLGFGFFIAYTKDRTVYTQSKSVILLARIEDATQTTNLSLTKKYIPTVKGIITTPKFINAANAIYGGGIYAGAISVREGNGMILNISYTDENPTVAAKKLDAFIEAAKDVIQNGVGDNEGLITADSVDFEAIDNVPLTTSSNEFVKFVLLGTLGGLVIGVALALLFYLLDNTMRSREDLERLTGSSVIAYLDDVVKIK